jgi:hypothetical protein
MLRFRK